MPANRTSPPNRAVSCGKDPAETVEEHDENDEIADDGDVDAAPSAEKGRGFIDNDAWGGLGFVGQASRIPNWGRLRIVESVMRPWRHTLVAVSKTRSQE